MMLKVEVVLRGSSIIYLLPGELLTGKWREKQKQSSWEKGGPWVPGPEGHLVFGKKVAELQDSTNFRPLENET